ncbi:MAG: 4Fe-4S binding protein [Fretibacterium sp.]|nr:4Fe-4S binding protein [Fretibacterium sp.]
MRSIFDYTWVFTVVYFGLGFFNILFAWLGLICFLIPLYGALFQGNKAFCNRYCGRGRLFDLLGGKLGLSRHRPAPLWLRSKFFRYGFLVFFMAMFFNMLWGTWLVFSSARELRVAVKLMWSFYVPWGWAAGSGAAPWSLQFSYGLYSLMLTSLLIGLGVMWLYKPRTWCVFCPMGTMTQWICKVKNGNTNEMHKKA